MSNQAFELAILISLKDAASSGADRVADRLRNMGKEGKAALKEFETLRKEFKQGLVLGGVGVAGLQMLRGGIKSAGDFEAALGDLRMSLEELGEGGRINLAKLGDEMNKAEALSVKLGNALPGTTQDFIQMLAVLKQGGLDVQTVLGGAGEAVANLAVVTGNVPAQLAEPFAQYVQQFQLKGDETTQLASTLAKLRFSTGLTPQELIEGSKFFQTRAGMPLGLSGLQGAEQSGRLLATLRSYGLEGGVGGRELGGFMTSLTFNSKPQQKELQKLKKEAGITLEFFDKKGSFLGFENVFAQMEKFRKLSTGQRLSFGEKLFGKEGMGIASIMMKAGVEGWQQINQRIDKVPALQELINQKTQTYNAKLEAVQGTLENLKATTFTPLLDTLKPALDLANQFTGQMQEFAKAHPGLAKMATELFGIGSAALIVAGSVKSMRAAWGLWKVASAVAAGDKGLLGALVSLRTEASKTAVEVGAAGRLTRAEAEAMLFGTGQAAESAARKVAWYRRSLGTVPSMIATTVAVYGISELMSYIQQLKGEKEQAYGEYAEVMESSRKTLGKMLAAPQLGIEFKANQTKDTAWSDLQGFLKTTRADAPWYTDLFNVLRATGVPLPKAGDAFATGSQGELETRLAKYLPNLERASYFASFMKSLEMSGLGQQERAMMEKGARTHFPGAAAEYDEAMKRYSGQWMEVLEGLTRIDQGKAAAAEQATDALQQKFTPAVEKSVSALQGLIDLKGGEGKGENQTTVSGAGKGSGRAAGGTGRGRGMKVPKGETGGYIEREGLIHIHSGERIVPAAQIRRDAGRAGGGGGTGTPTIHIASLTVHVPKGSRAAEDPEEFFRFVTKGVTRTVLRQRERR